MLPTPKVRGFSDPRLSSRQDVGYSAGKPYSLPELEFGAPKLVQQIHRLFQRIIDSYAEARQLDDRRGLPKSESCDTSNEEQFAELARAARSFQIYFRFGNRYFRAQMRCR